MSARIPRLSMEDLHPEVADALAPRVTRLGYLGEFFRVGGNLPMPMLDFIYYTESSKKALPDKLVELIALTVSSRAHNAYERNQHERLCLKLGFGEEWVKAVEALRPDGLGDVAEAAVQSLTLAALEEWGHGAGDELEAVIDHIGPQQAVAVLFVLGRYLVHAVFVNTLALQPPVESIFGTASDG